MEHELIEFLVTVDSLGMKGIKAEVQDSLKDLADCVQKTESEAKARMHVCVDENNLEPMMKLSQLCTNSKNLAEEIRKLTTGNISGLIHSEEAKKMETEKQKDVPVEEKEKETTPAPVKDEKKGQSDQMNVPDPVDGCKGKLTVSYLHRTPVSLEINKTKHELREKSFYGLFETLIKVQGTRDNNALKGWISSWQKNGNKQISFSNKMEKVDDIYFPEIKMYATITSNAEVLVNAILNLIDYCNLQDIYYVYFAPIK